MNRDSSNAKIYLHQIFFILFLISLMFVFAFVDLGLFEHARDELFFAHFMLRFVGGIVILYIMMQFGYSKIFRFKHIGKAILIVIPALIISINNFPFIAYFDGRAVLTEPVYRVFLFFVECLSIGFFEEIIFRGFLLVFLLKKLSDQKHGVLLSIVLSSLIFGLIHLFNIFSGATIGDTMLQIGYSFLVGMMWAVMYLKTKNIWIIMLLHATFNFFGQVMFYLGSVNRRYDIYTIIITVMFALLAAVYSYRIYERLEDDPLNELLS